MRNVNNVNELNGTQWLKNAVNFWFFEENNIDDIFDRFLSFCYKDRTGCGYLKNTDSIEIKKSDFSFNVISSLANAKQSISTILKGAYSSYHVVFLKKEIEDKVLLSSLLTDSLDVPGIEYRGRIIVYIKKTNEIFISLLFLNRLTEAINPRIDNEFRLDNYSLEKSFVIESKSKMDKIGLSHPAPYSYIDIKKLIEIENVKNKTVLDPFLGVGSTIIGTYEFNKNIGIELNKKYVDLTYQRFEFLKLPKTIIDDSQIICGDSLSEIDNLNTRFDVVITSPPYFNILKNKTSGVRTDNSQSRQGIEYYSESTKDLGNITECQAYFDSMFVLFSKIKNKISKNGKVFLIVSDFTVDKKEKDIHSSFVKLMDKAGFVYKGTSYILQNQKAIYPFGYPYKLVINHIFQYIIKFEAKS